MTACARHTPGMFIMLAMTLAALSSPVAADSAAKSGGWPTYGYTLANTRHVDFPQINAHTVPALALAWKFRTGVYGPFETSPIVVGRTMYVTTGADHAVIALDATSGEVKWRFASQVQPVSVCCGSVNRGVAVASGMVFVATIDDRLIALDARTGEQRWQTRIADPASAVSETMAPLAWGGLVYIGSSGGDAGDSDNGIRGFLSAYSQADGRLVWRWWSVSPGWEGTYVTHVHGLSLNRDVGEERREARTHPDAWRRGGGPIWMTPALDPARSTLYASVGNPSYGPGRVLPGDNLYTSSLVALDARSGRLKWFYQEVPHDVWNYDAASPPVLLSTRGAHGAAIAAVGEAGKTGWFYVLDRETGAVVRISDPFVPQHDIFERPTPAGVTVTPTGYGGAVAPVAYDATRHLVFVQAKQGSYFSRSTDQYWAPAGPTVETLSAVDVDTGRVVWHVAIGDAKSPNRMEGPLSAADVVFIGQEVGAVVQARRAQTGELLWSYRTAPGDESEADVAHRSFLEAARDMLATIKHWVMREPQTQASAPEQSQIYASPMAYVVDGREYIAVASGAHYRVRRSPGDTLYVFALPR